MKNIILSILLIAINSVFAVSFNYAIGNSTPSQTFQYTTSNNKFARLDIQITASTNISFFQYQMMGSLETDTESYIEVSCTNLLWHKLKSNHLSTYWGNDYTRAKGTINITVSGTTGSDSGGSRGLSQWGVTGTITITEIYQCPNTDVCASSTCEYCNNTYCSVHDQHCTGIYTHHESANQPETTHTFCTNDQALLQQWRSQVEGTCPDCGKFICKLCPHSCLDMPCPNGQYCQPTTCQICHGTYCGRHMLHLCQNYTEANNNTGNENINVQTTITGQAQVSVNITDNTRTVDMTQTNGLLSNIDNNTKNIDSKLDALKGSVDSQTTALSGKIDGVKTSIDNQTNELGGKLDGVKTSIDNQTDELSDKIGDVETAVGDLSSQNHSDLQTLSGDITGLGSSIGQSNTLLGQIKDKMDDFGDVNVDMSGTNGILGQIKTGIDSITSGDGNIGLGGVGTAVPNSGVGSEIVENSLTGSEIENVQKVTFFDQIKTKLSPPSLDVSTFDTTWEFDIPTIFSEPWHFSVDLNDNRLSTVRQIVRALSSVTMVVVFTFGIVRMIRQY